MSNVERICDKIGRMVLADALDVTKASVTNAISNGAFPSSWYEKLTELCAAQGIQCPTSLFSFRRDGQPTPSLESKSGQSLSGVET